MFVTEFQKKTTTQAFIMCERNTKGDKIIVAFRGTSPFDADDWSTDFDFSWCKIDGMGKTHMGFMIALGLQKYYHEDDSDKLGDYYGYFRKQIEQDPQTPLAYYTIRDKLKEIIANNKRAQIIVTGHSLGGALAILFPAVLALHEEWELLDKLEAIYTYGQPRVGNEQFGDFMNNNLREHNIKYYRIVYGFDCVPSVPLDNTLMTFKHFGTCIHFNSLYQGKILEEEYKKLVKETRNELSFMMKYLTLLRGILLTLMNFIIARLIAIWELVRGFFIGFVAGPYYKEGWLLLAFRTIGILFPGAANHNPQDYVNATMLTSENIFKYNL
ncbi:unnamed protein product [Amaranthus hypochondriacus]